MIFEKKRFSPSFRESLFCLTLLLLFGAVRPFFCLGQDLPPVENNNLRTYCLVIDSGHGGKDSGVIIEAGLLEKDLSLDIAQKIRELISSDTGIKAVLTRSGDYDVPLENRAAIANHQKADLFLSIHFSNHLYPPVEDLRVFIAAYSPEEMDFSSTAAENWQLMQSKHLVESREFAQCMLRASKLSGSFESIDFLEAPVYVLEGASMPAVEVEVGIASTQESLKKIENEEYRWQIAKALFQGILDYMKEQEQTP
jgi:N-acetylmuramoyl-L-alanine amidase